MAEHHESDVRRETIFTLEATPIKFGPGAVEDVGWELKRRGVRRAMLVSDPGVARLGITGRVRELIEAEGIACAVFDRARVEPTLASFQEAADFAREGQSSFAVEKSGAGTPVAPSGPSEWRFGIATAVCDGSDFDLCSFQTPAEPV